MRDQRSRLPSCLVGLLLLAPLAAAAQTNTQPDGLPAHPLDQTFPRAYPYPLKDLVLQTGGDAYPWRSAKAAKGSWPDGAWDLGPNLVGDWNTLHAKGQDSQTVPVNDGQLGYFKKAWHFQHDPRGKTDAVRGTIPADASRPDWTFAARVRIGTADDRRGHTIAVLGADLAVTILPNLENNKSGVDVTASGGYAIRGLLPVSDAAFHHVALVYASTVKCLSIYVDGQLDGRRCNRASGAVNDVQLGAPNDDVYVDEVFLYRRALSTAELSQLRGRAPAGLLRVYPPLPPDAAELKAAKSCDDCSVRFTTTAGAPVTASPPGQDGAKAMQALNLNPGKLVWEQTNASDLTGWPAITLAGWVRVPAGKNLATYNETFLAVSPQLGGAATGTLGAPVLSLSAANGLLGATVGGAYPASDSIAQAATSPRLVPGKFQFVAFTYDRTGARLFIDGYLVAEKPTPLRTLLALDPYRLSTTMGGGDGVEIAWLAQYDKALTATQLETLRHEGAAAWLLGAHENRAGAGGSGSSAQPVDIAQLGPSDAAGARRAQVFYYPDGATTSATTTLDLFADGAGPRAVGFEGGTGPLGAEPFSLFTRLFAPTLPFPATVPLVARKPVWTSRDTSVSLTMNCSSAGVCFMRALGYVPPDSTGVACMSATAASPTAIATCAPGEVITDFIDGATYASGSCDAGFSYGQGWVNRLSPLNAAARCVGKHSCNLTDLVPSADPGSPANLISARFACTAGDEANLCSVTSVSAADFAARKPVTLDCGEGKVFARIDRAVFTNLAAGHTTCAAGLQTDIYSPVSSEDATFAARSACVGKRSCTVALAQDTSFSPVAPFASLYAIGLCQPAPPVESPLCSFVPDLTKTNLACPAGTVIADVSQAVYGTTGGSCEAGFTAGSCNASGVLDKAKDRCLGRASCSFIEPHREFGDPCPGTAKKFGIKVTCRAPGVPQPVCATGTEAALTVACPAGQTIVAVDDAIYGVTTGQCTAGAPLVASCGADVKARVAERCVGRDSCSFTRPNLEFGDPCPNQLKTFTIRTRCQPPPPPPAPACLDSGEVPSKLACPPGKLIQSIDFAEYSNVGGTCEAPVTGTCASADAKNDVWKRTSLACVGRSECSFPAPSVYFGDTCPNVPKRFLARATCGDRAPRTWRSEAFTAPNARDARSIAFSWDGRRPGLAVDGTTRGFTLETDQAWQLPPQTAPATGLRTFVGPAGASPANTALRLSELRLYGRALTSAELEALGATCSALECTADGHACVDRATYSNARPITAQCGACTTAYWSVTGPPNDECVPDLDFMMLCSDNSQCALRCDGDRCASDDASFVARQCEAYGRFVQGGRCGGCLPDFVPGNDPADRFCYWAPSRKTGAECTADAQCLSGACTADGGAGYTPASPTIRCFEDSSETPRTISCATGQVVDEVFDALYGTPTATNEALKKADGTYGCGTTTSYASRPTWSAAASCNAANVLSTLKSRCVGNASCNVNAPVDEFGDPCPNVAKRFVVGYTCRPATPTVAANEPGGTCRPKSCGECTAVNAECSLGSYTVLATDYQKFKTRTDAPKCTDCKTGFEPAYRLLNPATCNRLQALPAASRVASELQEEPTLKRLRQYVLNAGVASGASVSAQDVANLWAAGVGKELTGLAGMAAGSEKTARLKALKDASAGKLDLNLWNCAAPGSPFDDPQSNGIVCRPPLQPKGATCPPPAVAGTSVNKHETCETGYCSPAGVCDVALDRVSDVAGENRRDDTSAQPADRKQIGEFGGTQQNESVLDLGQAGTPAPTALTACHAQPDKTELRMRQGQQTSMLGADSLGIIDVTVVGRKQTGNTYETTANLTAMGFPIAYEPKAIGSCQGNTDPETQKKCEKIESPAELARLSAPQLSFCVPAKTRSGKNTPLGSFIEKFTKKKLFIVNGIPITVEIAPLVDLCVGLEIARNGGESMSAYVGFKGAFGVGVEVRGGVGADIGIVELFIGIRAALVIAGLNPSYKRTIAVSEETSTLGTNEKSFKIQKGKQVELELEILSLGVSLVVEIKAWIFGWSVERKLAEIAGFKKKLYSDDPKDPPVYYTPCLLK